ncbi:MAG TPA: PQQ-dependent sugar dehydrogenase [Blastocatellia bacterium]|nr:PQQ-dependent sugar dehydrogenase [Blastocatellia bacterium]
MRKRNISAVLRLTALLIVCPAFFFVRADSSASTTRLQDVVEAPTAILLQPVLSGLSNTVYVTNSHDGTNRLFVIEKIGRIRVAQPGASTTTVFLDIVARVLSSGNEQGLLGLAFHPQYSINGRFFVYYTRPGDGAIVIAEYRVSPSDPNAGDPNSEIVILTIPHPTNTNHNGGTIEFGPDGFLYAGPGDGGSANDPPNNAQNINALLGKILRIDIDHPNGAVPYSSPPTNPFFGSTPGADEIYAYGMRNPYRFSFDRGTGQLWVGDVGQGAREEIDTVTLGGNYGWRVMEGMICNPNFGGGTCTPPQGSILPVFDYSHAGGRCSITGGFVYRGARSAVPTGAYVYADYCTGEMWQLLSGANSLLLDTSLNITSFGEDEAGEVYVVGQSGGVNRLTTSPSPPACSYSVSPTSRFFSATGGEAMLTLATAGDCGWLAAATVDWITITQARGVGGNTINFAVRENFTGNPRTGLIRVGGQSVTIVQDGSATPDCVFTLNPRFRNFNAGGGTGSINVIVEDRCAWSATPSTSWITITSGSVGTGNGAVNYSVAANTTGVSRKGTITIGDKVFNIKQK